MYVSVLSNGDDVVSNSKVFDGVVVFVLNFFLNLIAFLYFFTFCVKKSRIHARISSHSRDERR